MKMNYPVLILRRLLDVRAIILLLVMLGLKMDFVIVFFFLKVSLFIGRNLLQHV